MKHTIIILFVFFGGQQLLSQVQQFDKLEMLFDQGHYMKVYKLSNRLLDNPENDYSMLPSYYKSLSLLQLAQNEYWLAKHPDALDQAQKLFKEVKKSESGSKIFNAHIHELAEIKDDLYTWASDLKRMGNAVGFEKVQVVLKLIYTDLPELDLPDEIITHPLIKDSADVVFAPDVKSSDKRETIVALAKEQLGKPYVWAGNTSEGFDCSGFTNYILGKIGTDLPRRSSEQYDLARKVKGKNVQKGDLIFFNNGSGISHVGIVISEVGSPLVMIHSSSSNGIIITEIGQSEYWMKRLHGFGTYVD